MRLKGVKVGFALCGSHCTLPQTLPIVEQFVREGAQVYPIISHQVDTVDSRFGTAQGWKDDLKRITGHEPIASIVEAEPVGPQLGLDIVVVAPCTGNTLAKLANAITDSPVLMAVKSQLRNLKPVVLAVSTNDGLSNNLRNIGQVINMKNVYLCPFGQDNPKTKAYSLVAKLDLLLETVESALQGKQAQPILITYGG